MHSVNKQQIIFFQQSSTDEDSNTPEINDSLNGPVSDVPVELEEAECDESNYGNLEIKVVVKLLQNLPE